MNPDLLKYVKDELASGSSPEKIKTILTTAGWAEADVLSAIKTAQDAGVPLPRVNYTQPDEAQKPEEIQVTQTTSAVTLDHPPVEQKHIVSAVTLASSSRHIARRAIVGGVVFVLLSGGGAFAYYYFVANKALPPEEVMQKMYDALANIHTAQFSADLNVDGGNTSTAMNKNMLDAALLLAAAPGMINSSGTLPESPVPAEMPKYNYAFSTHMTGSSDITDPAHVKYATMMDITARISAGIISTNINASLEMRNIDSTFYIEVTKLPDLGIPGISLDQFKDKWIEIDPADIQNNLRSQFGVTSSTLKDAEKNMSLDADKVAKIRDLWRTSQVLNVDNALPEDVLNGVPTYHYHVTYDKNALTQFIVGAQEIVRGESLSDAEKETLASSTVGFQTMEGEIWIDKKTFYPLQHTAHIAAATNIGGMQAAGSSTMTVALSNINEPVSIQAPESAISINDFIKTLMPPMPSTTTSTSSSTKLKK